MGRKIGLTREQVVEAAAEIADRDGLDALSLATLASALGVRSPSLYAHVDGLAGLRRQLTLHASGLLTADLAEAVDGLEGTRPSERSPSNCGRSPTDTQACTARSFRPPPRTTIPRSPPPSANPFPSSPRSSTEWTSTRRP